MRILDSLENLRTTTFPNPEKMYICTLKIFADFLKFNYESLGFYP